MVCLSFFKTNNIDYYYNPKEEKAYFSCSECEERAVINLADTNWSCLSCDASGNLKTLIDLFNNGRFSNKKVYNPKKEKRDIKNMYNNLLAATDDEKFKSRLEYFMNKIEALIDHLDQSNENDNKKMTS